MTYTLTVASVNGGEYPSAGAFATTEEAERYIPRSFRGLSCYWRVWICDSNGDRIITATRAGRNGTGERWTFEPTTSETGANS